MELDIDQGNTRLKWRLSRQSICYGTLDELLQTVRTSRIKKIRLVSVVINSRQQNLINQIVVASNLPLTWSIAQSTGECMGVVNGYSNPAQLGTDRWCAIVAAALELQPPKKGLVVLGCGTAWTVDFIDSDKHHLGGWIAPGLVAINQGLRQSTNLNFDDVSTKLNKHFGLDSNDCINLGCYAMIEGFIQRLVRAADNYFDQDWILAVHGGNAASLIEYLPDRIKYYVANELVFDGLSYICDEKQHRTYPFT